MCDNYSVLVHAGDISGGHYFALIRPDTSDKWYRFDDDRVTPVSKKEVFEENFGDEPVRDQLSTFSTNNRVNAARLIKKFTNAYMLVYVRKSKLNEILGPVNETDIPVHLKQRLDAERAMIEKRKQDRQDMQLNDKVAVVTDKSFEQYQGFNMAGFDDRFMEVSQGVDVFKVPKADKISTFKEQLVDHYNLDPENFRLWSFVYRQNKMIRVDDVLTAADERTSKFIESSEEGFCLSGFVAVEKMRQNTSLNPMSTSFVKLYLETPENEKPLPVIKNDQRLVFIKYFDVAKQEMR